MQFVKIKREEFQISIRNQRREEIFKQKRLLKAEDLPFTTLINCSQIFYDAFHNANYLINSEDQLVQNILRIKDLQEFYSQHDCNQNQDTSMDVETIFDIFNKGFPKIDKACLEILLAFTLPNHSTCKPILKFLPELLQYYLETPFNVLKSSISLIFLNLCADCYQCRDSILIYEIPQKMYYSMKTITTELIEDLAQIIINISRIKPFITTYNQIQLYRLSIDLFQHIKSEEYKAGILQFIQKIYQQDKNLMDTKFIISLFQPNQSQKYQLEILTLTRVLSLFDRPKYQEQEDKILLYLQNIIETFTFEIEYDMIQSKIINKVLSILSNLILENPYILITIANSKIFTLFQWQNTQISQNQEIYQKIYFYSFFLQISRTLNNEEIKTMNKTLKPMEFLIYQIRNNEEDEDIILEILEIIEIILTKDPDQITRFLDQNGIAYLTELSHHENTKIYTYCERIFEIIE